MPSMPGLGRARRLMAGRKARLSVAAVVCLALAAALLTAAPRVLTGQQPAAQQQPPVPVQPVHPRLVHMPVMRTAARPVVRWPAAGSLVLAVDTAAGPAALRATTRAAAAGRRNVAMAGPSAGSPRPGGIPVQVGPPATASGPSAPAAAPSRVRLSMASHAAVAAAGISGVIFTLSRADGNAAAGRVHVSLDYASFAGADGGDYAGRLHLVQLPACALTSPELASCRRQVPVVSADDVTDDHLGADVTLPAAGSAGSAGQALVLAATTAVSGSGGSYAAAPLSESADWSDGGASGAFTYSYPIGVPPVPGGLEPSVSLDYDSQAVDGLTSSTNDQASWIGDGWDYQPGFIERDYQTCAANTSLPAADQTGDLCSNASVDVTTLSLNGTTTTLVDDPANGWHAEADNGAKITYETGTGSNGTHDDDYWVVTETDGTSYYFGLNEVPGYESSDPTDSAWTVPVYGPVPGDPCYNATFSQASCPQAWRWNLDYVTDSHGDAIAYFYNTETNYYAADGATTATAGYTQAGALASIDYGLRDGGVTPAAEVSFTTAQDRTDIPTGSTDDLACAKGASCDVTSPTFWTKYRLTTIATEALDGTTLEPVDSWALSQAYPSTGDATPASLWLSTITQTGQDGTPSVPLPPVSFAADTAMTNRVNLTDGYLPLTRYRITNIETETGEQIIVTYSPPSCPSPAPADDDNTSLCYPDWWTPPNNDTFEDWFNKYVVTQVSEQDPTAGQPEVNTNYCYGTAPGCLSGGAWHYNDDALVRSTQRTWDQWRGFQDVYTSTGTAPDPVTQTEDIYFRGMNGDYQSNGTTTTASLTSTTGGVTVTDADQYAGMDFEHVVFNGAGGPMVTATITTPESQQTASLSQPSPLPALTAYLTETAKTQSFTALASGGNREADTTYAYNSYGLVTSEEDVPDAYDNGVAGDASEDTCTQTTYAPNTTSGLVDLPAEKLVTSVPSASCPVPGTPAQAQLVSDTRYYYDGSTTLGAAPAAGNITLTQNATSYSGTAEVFTTQSQGAYDEYGRVTSATDADGYATTTSYTPATGAEPTSAAVTDPMTLTTTTTYDPLRELPLTVTTPAGQITTETYDALGRVTAVWLPTASKAGGQDATYTYSYDVSDTAPSVITTNIIEPGGTSYLTGETFYDAFGQSVETQDETPDGNTDITQTFYNSDGWTALVFHSYWTTGGPTATLVGPASSAASGDSAVPDQTGYVYDGTGRVTRQITYNQAVDQYETDTSYGGDYTTTTPPAGGTAQTTYTNGDGQTSYIYQYHSATPPATPPAPGSGAVAGASGWDQTAYTYTPAQQLATIADTAGNHWSYSYDLAGDLTSASDPDAGTSTSTYDPDGNLLSATSADGSTVSYVYDKDGRKTGEYAAPVASQSAASQIAAWVYDTLAKGQLTSATSYTGGSGTGGQAYTEQSLGYYSSGLPKGTEIKIPSGPLAGTYATADTYDAAGQLATYQDSAAAGLPGETVKIGYDAAADPVDISGASSYVNGLSYTELGQPLEYEYGSDSEPATLTDSYNYQGQLTQAKATASTSTSIVDDQNYAYDNAGNITSNADTPANGPAQVQCYTYDYLGRLVQAWSQGSTGCSAGPSQSAETTAAAPYWQAYTYNDENDLTAQTSTPASGSATTSTSTFPATTGADGPHAIASQETAGPTGTSTTSYGYDAAGETTSITTPTQTDTLAWTPAGQLSSVTSGSTSIASYIYDADGNLLLQTDGSTQTLYLPDEQLTATTSGTTTTLSGTRYYSLGDETVAARTSSGDVQYLISNQQGTATVAIDATTLNVTRRYYDPYGNPIGATPASWPGNRGFVGGTPDPATGLTNLGAREYNPATTTFISPDPILTPDDPQDLNAYAYATDNPSTDSDPTGQYKEGPGDGNSGVTCSPSNSWQTACGGSGHNPNGGSGRTSNKDTDQGSGSSDSGGSPYPLPPGLDPQHYGPAPPPPPVAHKTASTTPASQDTCGGLISHFDPGPGCNQSPQGTIPPEIDRLWHKVWPPTGWNPLINAFKSISKFNLINWGAVWTAIQYYARIEWAVLSETGSIIVGIIGDAGSIIVGIIGDGGEPLVPFVPTPNIPNCQLNPSACPEA